MQSVITLYPQGLTMGKVSHHKRKPPTRTSVSGWSTDTTRRHIKFLRSVQSSMIDGHGYAFTLTVKICPKSPSDWSSTRNKLLKRFHRMGAIRIHWLTEWQRRGTPHLHGSVYFNEPLEFGGAEIITHWIKCAADFGSLPCSQFVTGIYDKVGWAKYVAKHSARGVTHYQRSSENIPLEWQGKTGRMWGRIGDWHEANPMKFMLRNQNAFYRLRRLVRNWRVANARARNNDYHVFKAKTMLRSSNPELSRLNGVSEWLDLDNGMLFIAAVSESDADIIQVE